MPTRQNDNNDCHLEQVMIFIIKVKSRQFNKIADILSSNSSVSAKYRVYSKQ